jgi:hypothetical protein
MSAYDELGHWVESPTSRQTTIAWHDGFGGTHSQDMPPEDVDAFITKLGHVDWVEVVGTGVR